VRKVEEESGDMSEVTGVKSVDEVFRCVVFDRPISPGTKEKGLTSGWRLSTLKEACD
jgi:hypothetical protein